MTILTMVLYGSCARNDYDEKSDVDIFAISTDPNYRMIVQKKLNVASYPEALAFERARTGDLFMLHVVKEGRAIYETTGLFQKLQESFCYKDNYATEIANASDLGLMICKTASSVSNYTLINRRIAWCVRTILIAKSAEQRTPIFAANDLTNFSGSRAVLELIKNKNNDHFDRKLVESFSRFLESFGAPRLDARKLNILDDFRAFFSRTENLIGLKTIEFLADDAGHDYG